MGLASVVHNGIKIPFKFQHSDRVSLSHSKFSPLVSSFSSACHSRGALFFPILGFKRVVKDGRLTPSDVKRIYAQPKEDISKKEPSKDKSTQESLGDKTYSSSVRNVVLWVSAAVAFGVGLGFKEGVDKASEFFAGYILEQSLSVDNLFVFVLIFKYFKVPIMYQNRVLSYGIAGAVIFRLTLILLGTATLETFEAVNLLLAAILLYSSFKLFASEDDESDLSNNYVVKTCQKFIPVTTYYDGNRFITSQDGLWKATPLLLTVAVVEFSDIAFAVDSIPAVFGVTRDPFVVFSSNLFAILSLRSLYPIISEGMSELEFLQPSIAVVLGFIGCKMILDYFGIHVSTEASLGFVVICLTTGVLLSVAKKSD
ncbi:thylakoid membrane protein TERC, chloroplastic-like [Arachis stenosperma]|uniref:thylakoid membrane protein TERC, chloroplastic-like n=1 Tax=Arachis stenosperma TaxID=217475 RepID=UPI0025AC7878|nr:thylakoid membrane protein TERC, chloroplastic-like [Arachis stenosperma]